MSENERWTVKCQETADGTGDVIVDLPPELLPRLGLCLGDELTIEMVDGAIVLKPKHNTSSSPEFYFTPCTT
ncbi:AbrB family transcriptional regulator [Pseudomonas sp. MWU12-2312b]|uniref:AbrB/MazE/SpoVT family DNA-binding domain-containing protein n=1 Tax=Pseudomonas moorei TaxID=395599 RepID=UPI000D48387C|nr:AbrB/MazE/SpoVT family DNA-binding domain-containing protein [Pseudomonas moorei]PPA02661.1 AbrB family transcriptional regulator [Pseudomonas sp. MWU12-2312b]